MKKLLAAALALAMLLSASALSLTNEEIARIEKLEIRDTPVTSLHDLTVMRNLKQLTLSNCGISDISALSALPGLTMLDLSDNRVGDVSPLAGLANLQYLHLRGNGIADVGPLSNLKELRYLDLRGNGIADVSPLSNLTNLQTLLLEGNPVADYSPLAGLTLLQADFAVPAPEIEFVAEPVEEAVPEVIEAPTPVVTEAPTPVVTEAPAPTPIPVEELYAMQQAQALNSPEEWLVGHWTMSESRNDEHDTEPFSFGIDIYSVDGSGNVTMKWGANDVVGKWDRSTTTLSVWDQVYLLVDGMLGGGSRRFDGIGIKDGAEFLYWPQSIVGSWLMTEYRKDNTYTGVYTFPVNVYSIDASGNVDLEWGYNGRATGKWDSNRNALTVDIDTGRVYAFRGVALGGGNENYSGLAVQTSSAIVPIPQLAPSVVYPTISKGSDAEEIRKLQIELIERYFLYDPADGVYGPKTQQAVKRVQEAAGLPVTGVADSDTQTALYNMALDYTPQGDSGYMIYKAEYDIAEGKLYVHCENTGRQDVVRYLYEFRECNAAKAPIGDFIGGGSSYYITTYYERNMSPGEQHCWSRSLYSGFVLTFTDGSDHTIRFKDATKYIRVKLLTYTTADGVEHNANATSLFCAVK